MIMGAHNLNTGSKGRTKLGIALEQSTKEILAHVKGDSILPTRRIVLPDEVRGSASGPRRTCRRRSSRALFALIREHCRNGSEDGENPTQRPAHTSQLSPRTAEQY